MAERSVQEALEDIFGSDEENEQVTAPSGTVDEQTTTLDVAASRGLHDHLSKQPSDTHEPSVPQVDASGDTASRTDDFIDVSAADPELLREDPDDVIRTEGGWSSRSASEDEDQLSDEGARHPLTAFDRTMRQIQSRRQRKQITNRESERDAERILEKMRSAYDADLIMARLGRPALAKLRLLPEVDTELRRKEIRTTLIRRGLFEVLRRWLDPLPNGALPSIDVRSTLMDILLTFQTRVSDSEDELEEEETATELQRSSARRAGTRAWERALLNSGLGRCIHYYKLYDPDPACQLKAERLVMRWAAAVLHSDTNYRNALHKRYEMVPARSGSQAQRREAPNRTSGATDLPAKHETASNAPGLPATATPDHFTNPMKSSAPAVLAAALPERPSGDWKRIPQVGELPAVPRMRSVREKQMSKHLKRIRDTVQMSGVERGVSTTR